MKNDDLAWFYWPLFAALTWLVSMVWVWTQIGTTGIGWGLPLSALVTLPMVGAFLWLSRWVQGRSSLLLSAFAWGASVAGFCAIWSQEALQALIDAYAGVEFGSWFRPLVVTPITEELFKGLFLVWLLIYRRSQIRGLLDGVVFGGLVGAGFASSEQTMYFGQVVATYIANAPTNTTAGLTLALSFVLRGVMVPFMHSFFVAFVGLGVAAAAGMRSRALQSVVVLLGFLFPTVLHGAWDWAALAGGDRFMIYKMYATVMFPLFLGLTIFALILRHRRGQAVIASLPSLAQERHIMRQDVAVLGSLKERRRWRDEARRLAGHAAARSTGRYQAEVSALAVLVGRTLAPDGDDQVSEQVKAVNRARNEMVGAATPSR